MEHTSGEPHGRKGESREQVLIYRVFHRICKQTGLIWAGKGAGTAKVNRDTCFMVMVI